MKNIGLKESDDTATEVDTGLLTGWLTEACLVGIVCADDETQQSIAPVVQDADGNRIEQFEPGLIAYARGGKDIKFNQPASTAGVYE